ncbi:PREDICTED: BLOC-1-related complex subunit 6 [Gavialis gangeticus]|uniref:BLOC-1-related complex subunit 6 n=1 Tax=Gavialis gangeticus TaxID=94835 RepID=UPI00092E7F40|nr:PREDICTED: BLOC-1-related complex subunit 6 [Gavialis gangeticus]
MRSTSGPIRFPRGSSCTAMAEAAVAESMEREGTRERPAELIPPVDPEALAELAALGAQLAAQVDELLRSLRAGLAARTALSVGCIHAYRDGAESLGEAADAGVRALYTLVARCEELDRAMQPVPALAARIRCLKGALDRLDALCK